MPSLGAAARGDAKRVAEQAEKRVQAIPTSEGPLLTSEPRAECKAQYPAHRGSKLSGILGANRWSRLVPFIGTLDQQLLPTGERAHLDEDPIEHLALQNTGFTGRPAASCQLKTSPLPSPDSSRWPGGQARLNITPPDRANPGGDREGFDLGPRDRPGFLRLGCRVGELDVGKVLGVANERIAGAQGPVGKAREAFQSLAVAPPAAPIGAGVLQNRAERSLVHFGAAGGFRRGNSQPRQELANSRGYDRYERINLPLLSVRSVGASTVSNSHAYAPFIFRSDRHAPKVGHSQRVSNLLMNRTRRTIFMVDQKTIEVPMSLAALQLGRSWHATYRLVLTGAIRGRLIGGRWFVEVSSLEAIQKAQAPHATAA